MLNDFSSASMVSSVEESLREFWTNWGKAPQSEIYDRPHVLRLYTGVPYAFCNGVIARQLSPEGIDSEIAETIAYFADREATWEWMVGPNSSPATLDKSLERHALVASGESVGMAVNLREQYKDIPSIDNLRIIQAREDETLKTWANTMIEGFESPALYPSFVDLECSLGCQQSSYRRYLGILNQQPVSTCALFLGEKVAGLYCVSTVPTARKMGIGAAITQYALREAQAMGYNIAVLQSTKMGRTVYRKLGFQEFSILRAYRPAR